MRIAQRLWRFTKDDGSLTIPALPRQKLAGPPLGATIKLLDDLCERVFGDRLDDVCHAFLRTHKQVRANWPAFTEYQPVLVGRHTCRVHMRTHRGARWTAICKNDPRPEEMDTFPQYWFYGTARRKDESPVEALIYGSDYPPLMEFLPRALACTELIPGRVYQYLLEDLTDCRPASSPETVLRAVARLPELHAALDQWSSALPVGRLFSVDKLTEIITARVQHFVRSASDPFVRKVFDLWQRLQDRAAQNDLASIQQLAPIHGDLWVDNVMPSMHRPSCLKVIDWESVLLGRRHTDLATLLIRETPELHEEALAIYARRDTRLSLAEHRLMLQWCLPHRDDWLRNSILGTSDGDTDCDAPLRTSLYRATFPARLKGRRVTVGGIICKGLRSQQRLARARTGP